jgi:dihydroneopterin aldolase
MKRIFLENYIVLASIGIHPKEKIQKQRLSISVSIKIKGSEILDYSFIKNIIDSTVSEKHYDYQEDFANQLLNVFLSIPDRDRLDEISIITKKLDIYSGCSGVGIEISWSNTINLNL